jgi:hypothetical protein
VAPTPPATPAAAAPVAPPPAPGLPAPVAYVPTFYQTGYTYQWVNTGWGMAWQAVPTGFYQ